MTYTISIDQEFALMHDLTLTQVSTLAAFMTLPVWTKTIAIDGVVWYYYSDEKMAKDFPLLFGVAKRCYKNISELAVQGFVRLTKLGRDKYVTFTEKCAEWGRQKVVQKRTDSPKVDWNESENGLEKSPKMDCKTNNINNQDNLTKENTLFPEENKVKKNRGTSENLCLFENSRYNDFDEFKKCFVKEDYKDIDIAYYFECVKDWSAAGGKKKRDWIATARNFMRADREKGKLKTIRKDYDSMFGLPQGAIDYLKMGSDE